ncbi:MAG: putative rane protein [Gemmatimonadetes bacterium]|nr:putative rane protein [Gemmatimonadota bacterium]
MGTTMTMADCGLATRDLFARLTSPSRNRYYYGKLLDAYHLELEQSYGNSKRWMLNRLSLGAGVLCGLGVTVTSDKKRVRVQSGVAIDYFGREIIVPQQSQPFDPTQPTDDCGRPVGDPLERGRVTLYLCYHECEAEPAPAMVDECGDSACENGLVRERYSLRVAEGTPRPPGVITDAQCKRIDETPAPGVDRRTVICQTLGGPCGVPDDSCIPIATLELDDGQIASVDTCTFRPNVYSNAVLLDLILCLAERVDECCGPVAAVETIAIARGDGQAGLVGQPLANPLVAVVMKGGVPVNLEDVTFTVDAGGGSIGATTATLGATFTAKTDAAGEATLPVWKLGPTPGSVQRVRASIPNGAFVVFNAKAEPAPVANPPVIRAIWPPNGAQLGANSPSPERNWFKRFRELQTLEITFDRKMRQAQLQSPEPWLRMFALVSRGGVENVATTAVRILMGYDTTVASPVLGVSGVTERYRLDVPAALFRQDVRFLIQIDSSSGNIVEAGAPNLELDADFAGTKLTKSQLDKLWPLTGSASSDLATFNALANGPAAPLPQSGDGTPGGRFHSWFEVIP